MKKIFFTVCLLAGMSTHAYSRDYSGPTGGFDLSIGSASSSGNEPTLSRSTAYGAGAHIGYMMNKGFSLEVAYTNVGGPQWGVVSVTNSSLSVNALVFINTSKVYRNAIYLQFGMGMLTTSANLSDSPNSRSNQGGVFGIGYEFNHGEMDAFRVGMTVYDTGYNQVRLLSAGPVWKF